MKNEYSDYKSKKIDLLTLLMQNFSFKIGVKIFKQKRTELTQINIECFFFF